jgi:general secretion pathway protein M
MAVSLGSPRRIAALLVVALMILVPLLWVFWSVGTSSTVAQSNRAQTEALQALSVRLAALNAGSSEARADTANVFLPGETEALAGAALQRLVATTVENAGGHLEESEISRPEGPDEEPTAVSLRVSFDADIVGLQQIIFELETGAPILMLDTLTIEAKEAASAESGDESPTLSIVMLVRGYREAA